VGHVMDVYRLADEQMPGQDYKIISGKWFGSSPIKMALELVEGGKIVSDIPKMGNEIEVVELHHLHYPLFDIELDRLRWLGAAVNNVYLKLSKLIPPGITESELAILFRHELDKEQISSAVSIVGSDERVFKHRHPMPSSKIIEKYIMMHVGARRWGLHAPITRNFHFVPLRFETGKH